MTANQITFSTKTLEATNANELIIIRATRSVKKDGKEIPSSVQTSLRESSASRKRSQRKLTNS
jgi:hypothetical protein